MEGHSAVKILASYTSGLKSNPQNSPEGVWWLAVIIPVVETQTGGSLPGLAGPQLSLVIASSQAVRSNLKNINTLTTPEAELWLLYTHQKKKNSCTHTHTDIHRHTHTNIPAN